MNSRLINAIVLGMMMMGNMSMNPAMAASNSNPYNMFMGMQPTPQQQQQQQPHANTLSTNLWQWEVMIAPPSKTNELKKRKIPKVSLPQGLFSNFFSLSLKSPIGFTTRYSC